MSSLALDKNLNGLICDKNFIIGWSEETIYWWKDRLLVSEWKCTGSVKDAWAWNE